MNVFITFGAGQQQYEDACNRLTKQASNLGIFNKIKAFTETDLKSDSEFWNRHSDFIRKNPRGYGYWLWKPYIIKKTMDTMQDGDILLYLDCGCEILPWKKDNITQYFEYAKTDSIIMDPNCLEYELCKMDLIVKLGMLKDEYLKTHQHQAGAIMFCVNDKTRKLVAEWYELGCDYHLIDDSPSVFPNVPGFHEHRHDQSIFSLLTKKYNLYSYRNIKGAIEYVRNRSGTSLWGIS